MSAIDNFPFAISRRQRRIFSVSFLDQVTVVDSLQESQVLSKVLTKRLAVESWDFLKGVSLGLQQRLLSAFGLELEFQKPRTFDFLAILLY